MSKYKQAGKMQIDSEFVPAMPRYSPQITDLPNIYNDIQIYFENKDVENLIIALDRLKIYMSAFLIKNTIQFQDILFPVLTTICKIPDNDSLVFYGFEFTSFIMKKFINYIPLFTEPDFFEYSFSFLADSNQKKEIIFYALENIENFICLSQNPNINFETRNYSIERLPVQDIIKTFITNKYFYTQEKDRYNIQVKALKILKCYTLYPIDESNARQIFEICDIILGAEPEFTFLFEDALSIIINLYENNLSFQKIMFDIPKFNEKIEVFAYDSNSETVYLSLYILYFYICHNYAPSKKFFQNFLSILCHINDKVSQIAFDCLEKILEMQMDNAIKQLESNGFFRDLKFILLSNHYEVKLKAANVACILLEKGGPIITTPIFRNGYVHIYLIILQFEDDEIRLRILRRLHEIFLQNNANFYYANSVEETIFEELVESPNFEISNLARDFVCRIIKEPKMSERFIYNNPPRNATRQIHKRIQTQPEEQPVKRSKIRMWYPKKTPRTNNNNFEQNDEISSISSCYYHNAWEEEEEEYM